MGRKEAIPLQGEGRAPDAPSRRVASHLRSRFGVKSALAAAAVLALLGTVAFAVVRETSTTGRAATDAPSRPAKPPRPAFSPAEEAYVQALWPIHGDVQRSSVRMALGQIFYKVNDMDRASLKKRVDEALATYRRSETRLRALGPPTTMRGAHEEYLAALLLFQQSAVEVLRMFEDGRDDHMLAAYPQSQKASDKIREVGSKFWPHEFPPN